MEDPNEKRNLTELIPGILTATGLAIVVIIATVYMLNGYETKSIIKSLVINLIIAHAMLFALMIIGESFIEDIIKAILVTLISMPFWFTNFENINFVRENIDFVRCILLSIALGAWYLVVLKIFDLGSGLKLNPLHDAAVKGDKKEAELLITKGADVNAENEYGYTPLHKAALKGHKEIAELLIAKGADVNAKDKVVSSTPLYDAARRGHQDVAELLIAEGADVNTENKYGYTPLHDASRGGYQEIVELLIAKGADVNAESKDGETPLHEAVRNNQKEVAKLLRRHSGM